LVLLAQVTAKNDGDPFVAQSVQLTTINDWRKNILYAIWDNYKPD